MAEVYFDSRIKIHIGQDAINYAKMLERQRKKHLSTKGDKGN